MEAGADAFVLKRAIATDLLSAVDAVRGGASVEASACDAKPT
jgi:DNA-binding NarL/FixJ family response regulator